MGSKISNTEWGLVIGALLFIDGVQLLLDFMLIGPFVNSSIDLVVGMAFTLYMKLRGVSLDKKKIGGMATAFGLELIPGFDALPLWSIDGVINMMLDKADKKLKKSSESAPEQGNQQSGETQKKAA